MAGFQGTATRKDFMEFIAGAVESGIREVNTTFDATVVSYDRSTQLATIQPKLKRKFGDKDLTAPPLEKIRIAMPSGGPDGVHFDLKPGDPLVAHARMRNTDTSQGDGSDANASPGRMHDLSDVIAYPGGGPDTSKMDNMPAGGTHFGKKDGKSGLQTRADGSSAIVGGPSGSDKFRVGADGKIDMVGENGDSLFQIIRDLATTFRNHTNTGAPLDGPFAAAADAIIARLDAIHG
jgi:hypothetical protein